MMRAKTMPQPRLDAVTRALTASYTAAEQAATVLRSGRGKNSHAFRRALAIMQAIDETREMVIPMMRRWARGDDEAYAAVYGRSWIGRPAPVDDTPLLEVEQW